MLAKHALIATLTSGFTRQITASCIHWFGTPSLNFMSLALAKNFIVAFKGVSKYILYITPNNSMKNPGLKVQEIVHPCNFGN